MENKVKNILLLLISFCCPLTKINAQIDTVKVGFFITNLYDFDIANDAFTAEFWLWTNYKNKKLSFKSSPEVKGSKKAEFSNFLLEEKDGIQWAQKKCKTTHVQDWDVKKFPFDSQKLKIQFEESSLPSSSLIYKIDALNTRIDSQLVFSNWQIDSMVSRDLINTSNTTYGDPSLTGSSSYAGIESVIYISRKSSLMLLFKLMTGLFVAFLISLLVFMIPSSDSQSRIGLAVGGLFAAVGNKYIVESIVPISTQNTLIDNLHNITFSFILIIISMVIYIANQYSSFNERWSFRFSKISFWSIFLSYILIILFIFYNCLN